MRTGDPINNEERVREAFQQGLDVIAVTNSGQEPEEIRYIAERRYLMQWTTGLETGTAAGERLVGLSFWNYRPVDEGVWAAKPGEKTVFYQDQMAALSKAGGVLVVSRAREAAVKPGGLSEAVRWGVEKGFIVGMEVCSGGRSDADAFERAVENRLGVFANSDAHGMRFGKAVTLLLVKERSFAGVNGGIRGRRAVAWFDDKLWGCEEWLARMIEAWVSIKLTRSPEGNLNLLVENRCPITFQASVEGASGHSVTVPGQSQTRFTWSKPAEAVRIRWGNVWINPGQNLCTKVKPS
jgi:hypothetical protein